MRTCEIPDFSKQKQNVVAVKAGVRERQEQNLEFKNFRIENSGIRTPSSINQDFSRAVPPNYPQNLDEVSRLLGN